MVLLYSQNLYFAVWFAEIMNFLFIKIKFSDFAVCTYLLTNSRNFDKMYDEKRIFCKNAHVKNKMFSVSSPWHSSRWTEAIVWNIPSLVYFGIFWWPWSDVIIYELMSSSNSTCTYLFIIEQLILLFTQTSLYWQTH